MDEISYRRLDSSELTIAMGILQQEPFSSHDNTNTKLTDIEWLTSLLNDGYAFALVLNQVEIVGVLFAENLLEDGVLLWLIATKPEHHNKKYGTILLREFENHVKCCGRKWMYLNSTEESLKFYKKNDYMLKPYDVFECYKEL